MNLKLGRRGKLAVTSLCMLVALASIPIITNVVGYLAVKYDMPKVSSQIEMEHYCRKAAPEFEDASIMGKTFKYGKKVSCEEYLREYVASKWDD